jgi:DNA primase
MAYYGDDIVERVREATDIVDLIEEFLPLKRRGRNYWARCPFHQEKTPSFSVSPDKQIFHCFGCQKGGNVFGFVMEYEKLPFPEALKYLAQRAGIELPTHQARTESKEIERLYFAHEMAADFFFENLKSSTATLDYLRKRGIKDDTIRKFRIGYAPDSWDALTNHAHSKDLDDQDLIRAGLVVERDDGGVYDRFRGRLIFTIFNTIGKPIAFGARALKEDETAKYINSPETPLYSKARVLYGLSHSRTEIRRAEEAIVVEGYFDLLSLYQAGIRNVVASSGTAFTREQAQLLGRSAPSVVLMFDADSAGQQAAIRSVDYLFEAGIDVKVASLPQGEDPDSMVREAGADAFKEQVSRAQSFVQFSMATLPDRYENLSIAMKDKALKRLTMLAARISDPIKRELFIHDIARWYQIDEAVVKQAVRPQSSKPPAREVAESPKSVRLEDDTISLLMAYPELIDVAAEKLAPIDFSDPDAADIYSLFVLMHQEGKTVEPSVLIDRLKSSAQKQRVAALAAEPPETTDPADLLDDLLQAFSRRRRKKRLADLKRALADAEREQDQEKINYYMTEIARLRTQQT